MKIIRSEQMPKVNGHYSQCIEHNGFLFLSGQLPIDPKTNKIPKHIEDQTEQALLNIQKVLIEAGRTKKQIIQMRIYISSIDLWDKVNEVYSNFFGEHKPVRTIVPVRELHFGCLIEIEAVAVN